jgi:hypothetical protein
MAASFSSPNPDLKRLFEIYHFYVEGKANREKTFGCRILRRAELRTKEDPKRGGEALGAGELGGSPV